MASTCWRPSSSNWIRDESMKHALKSFLLVSLAWTVFGAETSQSFQRGGIVRGGTIIRRGTEVQGGGDMAADEIRMEIIRTGFKVYFTLYERPLAQVRLPNGK